MLTFPALRHALSPERLAAYSLAADRDELDGVARYLWNLGCANALLPALHTAEITFRNALFTGGEKVFRGGASRFADLPCWLDADPPRLAQHEHESVCQAKERLRERFRGRRSPLTCGRLVSALPFGFWTGLCKPDYDTGMHPSRPLWPDVLRHAFIFAPKPARSRTAIKQRFDAIRALRNRIAHHEPVWDRDLPRAHDEILEAVAWMNRGVAATLRRESALPAVVAAGPQSYRARAEALFARRDD